MDKKQKLDTEREKPTITLIGFKGKDSRFPDLALAIVWDAYITTIARIQKIAAEQPE